MASLHKKISRGHAYWYLVQSRRVHGKPRPVVLAYLGKPEDLLRRLVCRLSTIQVRFRRRKRCSNATLRRGENPRLRRVFPGFPRKAVGVS